MAVPAVRPQLLAAVSGHSAAHARHRAVPAQRLPEAFRWHQPQPAGRSGNGSRALRSSAGFSGIWSCSAGERIAAACPQILGIDEHFFTRRRGYATTFCDLKNHKIYDVVLGRSEAALEGYLERLEGKHQVKIVCMDLAAGVPRAGAQAFSRRRGSWLTAFTSCEW